jgi:hypothetical protein
MEDDPDYIQLTRFMTTFIALPILFYGIMRMLFYVLAGLTGNQAFRNAPLMRFRREPDTFWCFPSCPV